MPNARDLLRTLTTAAPLAALFALTTTPAAAQRVPVPRPVGQSAPAASTAPGSIRGVVFDSLSMQPLAKAFVFLLGGTQTAVTDDNGHFTLADVPPGDQTVSISSPALDSLGLSSLGGTARVIAGEVTQLNVASPSFVKVWKSLCGFSDRVGNDSGIVWGTVRDAATDTRLAGSAVAFNWYNLQLGSDKRLSFGEITRATRTDSTGAYYACGLPTEITISSEAAGTRSASGAVEYAIGARRLHRVDLLVSTDMVGAKGAAPRSARDTAAMLRPHGTATLRGNVHDATGKPVAGAMVTLASVDTAVRTSATGEFTMTSLPAGTQGLQVRQIGFGPAMSLVELRPGQTTEAAVELPSARTLATFNVRANSVTASDRSGFDSRRRSGFGYALENKDFANRPDMTSVLREMPSVTVTRGTNGTTSVTLPGRQGGQCSAVIYVDGSRSDTDAINSLDPATVRAVEVYPRETMIPAEFASFARCGVIAFWTRFAKWGTP